MALGYAEDEDELQDADGDSPYAAITNREPLEDISPLGIAQRKLSPSVKDTIAARRGLGTSPDVLNDPLMKQYESQQAELDKFRDAKAAASQSANIGQIASQLAAGSNASHGSDSLYKNMNAQAGDLLKSKEEDLDRRQKIINAIEARKSRESVAADNRAMRAAVLKGAQDQKDKTRAIQVNRLLGQTEKELREDPIAKPSEMNVASLQKSKMILDNSSVPLTPQALSDAEQDIASALALRGQGATEGKIHRTELNTLGRKFAEAKQKWGNKIVDLRKEEPELVAQISKMNQALIDDYKATIAQRKHSILDDKDSIWGDDPVFAQKLQALRGSITKRFGERPSVEEATAVAKRPGSPNSFGQDTQSGGLISSANAGGGPKVKRKQFSPSRNQTKITYDDGSEVIVDGKQ